MARRLDYNASLTRREEVTEGLGIFQVELDSPLEPKPGEVTPFLPGQYLTIGLNRPEDDPEDTRPASVLRPMTIASPPEQSGVLEFYIRYINKPDSRLPLTHLLWNLSEGSRLYVRPCATGRFTEKDTVGACDPRARIMIAGGTGLAPFISLLRSRVSQAPAIRLENYALLHGVSNPSFLGYRRELEELVDRTGLRYIPTVSRPHESPGWRGAEGRVEHLLSRERVGDTEAQLGIPLHPAHAAVMVCGLRGTIAATLKALLARGFVPEHRRIKKLLGEEKTQPSVFYEQYDTEPLFNLKDPEIQADLLHVWAQRPTAPGT